MSGDEQDQAILRLVKQRHETKKRKAALQSELREAGQRLWEIGGSLKSVCSESNAGQTPANILSSVKKAPDICGLERIKSMLEELRDAEQTIADLNRSAKELGID